MKIVASGLEHIHVLSFDLVALQLTNNVFITENNCYA
jgi:hypothetical protein